MCRCTPTVRTPCCGSVECHGIDGLKSCPFCYRKQRQEAAVKAANPSFYTTVTESVQWKEWEEHQKCLRASGMGPTYDMAEVMECGWISQHHFQDFLDFCGSRWTRS